MSDMIGRYRNKIWGFACIEGKPVAGATVLEVSRGRNWDEGSFDAIITLRAETGDRTWEATCTQRLDGKDTVRLMLSGFVPVVYDPQDPTQLILLDLATTEGTPAGGMVEYWRIRDRLAHMHAHGPFVAAVQ